MTINTKGVFTEEEIQRAEKSLGNMLIKKGVYTMEDLNDMIEDEDIKLDKQETYIVAGNRAEFDNYVHKKLAEDVDNYGKEYIYVRDRYTLMGLSNIKGYYIGTAFMRKDIDQIKQAIAYVKEKANLPHDDN